MVEWFKRAWQRLVFLFPARRVISRHDNHPPPSALGNVEHRSRSKDIEDTGRWFYLRNILDELDAYFNFIGIIRKIDPDHFDLFRQIGGVVSNDHGGSIDAELPPSWKSGARPSFGCLLVARRERTDDDLIPAKFIYFNKINFPKGAVQAFRGDRYLVTMAYDWRNGGVGFSYCVGVASDGTVKLLRQLEIMRGPIPTRVWRYPTDVTADFKENKSRVEAYKTPANWAESMFRWAVGLHENATSDVRVAATRGSRTAAFSVDLLRMPYFFRERDFVAASDGRRKRIFHIVRTHSRQTKSGETWVRSHFRGARKFRWNDYDITISMPGKHHADLIDFEAMAVLTDEPPTKDLLTTRTTGKILRDHMAA